MGDQAVGLLSNFLRARRLRAARPYLRGRVLDVGCGVGALAPLCEPDRYLGIDADDESLAVARTLHPRHRFAPSADPDDRFDVIVMLAVIEHVRDPAAFLKGFRPHLAQGGRMVLTTPYRRAAWTHALGARLGLCSRQADEEHEVFFDEPIMRATAAYAGLRIAEYRRFLFGLNQLFVLERA